MKHHSNKELWNPAQTFVSTLTGKCLIAGPLTFFSGANMGLTFVTLSEMSSQQLDRLPRNEIKTFLLLHFPLWSINVLLRRRINHHFGNSNTFIYNRESQCKHLLTKCWHLYQPQQILEGWQAQSKAVSMVGVKLTPANAKKVGRNFIDSNTTSLNRPEVEIPS